MGCAMISISELRNIDIRDTVYLVFTYNNKELIVLKVHMIKNRTKWCNQGLHLAGPPSWMQTLSTYILTFDSTPSIVLLACNCNIHS